MGDRGQVLIEDLGVYLYTHWSASDLVETTRRALAKKWRWDDPEYLARIIFDEMKGDDRSETGFGIGTQKHEDVWRLVLVNCSTKTVTVQKCNFETEPKTEKSYTFEEFISDELEVGM